MRTPASSPPPCLLDPLSISGLRRLQRDRSDWRVVVARSLPPAPTIAADPTVRVALAAGALDLEVLQTGSGHAFRRHRQSARHAAQAAPAKLRLSEITDEALQVARGKLEGQGLSRESVTRALTLLRRLARAWAAETGQEPHVTSRPTRAASKALKPAERPVWSPQQVSALLAALRDRGARVAVALAVGCGLQPGEVRHVRHVDLDLRRHLLTVHGADRSKPPRVMPMPGWVEDLISHYLDAWSRSGRPTSPWLLPSARAPRRPRRDFGRLLQVAQRAAGLASMPPVTLLTLRRTYQWFALHAGLPTETARGSWTVSPDGTLPSWWPSLQRFTRREWRTLCGLDPARWPPPTTMVATRRGLVPAELADARRRVPLAPPPLPASVAPLEQP